MNFLTHIAADGTPTVIPIDFAKVFGPSTAYDVNEIRLFVRDCEERASARAADRIHELEGTLDAIEATLDGCEADEGCRDDSLPNRVQAVCAAADEDGKGKDELQEAVNEAIETLRRVSCG